MRNQEIDKTRPVSVVIVSNNTRFLVETLDSVLIQTHSLFEVILVLNGGAVLNFEFYSEYFLRNKLSGKVIISEVEGIVRARNLAIINARYDLICTIDSDDIMPPNRIKEQVEEFGRNEKLVCLGGQIKYIGNFQNVEPFRYPISFKNTVHSLYRQASLPQPGSMFLTDKFIDVGSYREAHPYIEDWDLWLRLSKVGEIYNLDTPTVGYRLHANQSTKIHKEEIKRNTINLLFENLELRIRENSSMPNLPDGAWRKRVLKESIKVLLHLQKNNSRISKHEIRCRLAGIVYQTYVDRLTKGKLLSAICLGFMSTFIDPRILENRVLKTWVGKKLVPGYKF